MLKGYSVTFWHLARSRGVCPPAGLLRQLTGCEASCLWSSCALIGSSSSCSSSEEELKKSGSSFSMFLSAPDEQTAGKRTCKPGVHCACVCSLANQGLRTSVCVLPAAISMEQSVGEPCPAARWRAVFPPNEQASTSAFSCKENDDVIKVRVC